MKPSSLLPWALLLIVCFFFWRSCQNDPGKDNVVNVTIPEQTSTFDAVKPKQEVISTKPASVLNSVNTEPTSVVKSANTEALSEASRQAYEKDLLIAKLLQQNDSLSIAFSKKNDSLKQVAYNEANKIRDYKQTFEDSLSKTEVSGLVRGEIQSMAATVKIKERKVPVSVKTWRVLGGAEIGSNQKLDRFASKANVRYQSAKGDLYSAGIDNNRTFWFGYDVEIFKRTKAK